MPFTIQILLCLFLGLIVGITNASLGLGGGFALVPAFTLIFGWDMRYAVGTTLVVTSINTFIGSIRHYQMGNVKLEYSLITLIGATIGLQIGLLIIKNVDQLFLKKIFGVILLFISIRMMVGK